MSLLQEIKDRLHKMEEDFLTSKDANKLNQKKRKDILLGLLGEFKEIKELGLEIDICEQLAKKLPGIPQDSNPILIIKRRGSERYRLNVSANIEGDRYFELNKFNYWLTDTHMGLQEEEHYQHCGASDIPYLERKIADIIIRTNFLSAR